MENYNTDLSKRVKIHTAKETFINSLEDRVNIIPLESEGTESGRATSIVEYEAPRRSGSSVESSSLS